MPSKSDSPPSMIRLYLVFGKQLIQSLAKHFKSTSLPLLQLLSAYSLKHLSPKLYYRFGHACNLNYDPCKKPLKLLSVFMHLSSNNTTDHLLMTLTQHLQGSSREGHFITTEGANSL